MKADAIIILGGGISQEGALSQITINRLEKGIELFKKKVSENIVVSGKYNFMEDYIPNITEARAMSKYLERKGIPKEKIILEEESKDTIGNAFFTKTNVLEPRKWRTIIVITSEFHIQRTKYVFKKILGEKYKIYFVEASSGFSDYKIKELIMKEQKVLNLVKQWLDKIPDGEDKLIKNLLYTKHPAYAEHPEITKEQLKKIIGNAHQNSKF